MDKDFQNLSHQILYTKVLRFLNLGISYLGLEYGVIKFLLQQTIFTNAATSCRIKGSKANWQGLPKDKSLFNKPQGYGLPIGNLTSQIFGNVYLNDLDQYIKKELKIKYYGRYVDDMVFVHQDKNVLKNSIPHIQKELDNVGT